MKPSNLLDDTHLGGEEASMRLRAPQQQDHPVVSLCIKDIQTQIRVKIHPKSGSLGLLARVVETRRENVLRRHIGSKGETTC